MKMTVVVWVAFEGGSHTDSGGVVTDCLASHGHGVDGNHVGTKGHSGGGCVF
jgi:hypothetical protein